MAATRTPGRGRIKDIQGVGLRGGSYQVRVYGGRDPLPGGQVVLTRRATTESVAIELRNRLQVDPAERESALTTGTVSDLPIMRLGQHSADVETVKHRRTRTGSLSRHWAP